MAEFAAVIWLICVVAAPFLARSKGRSVVGWFVLVFLFNFLALIVLAALPDKESRFYGDPHPLYQPSNGREDKIEALRNTVPRVNRLQEKCNNIIYDIEGTFVEFPAEETFASVRTTYHRALAGREQAVNRLERATDTALVRADPDRALAEALAAEDTMRSSLAALRTVEKQLFPNRMPSPLLEDHGYD